MANYLKQTPELRKWLSTNVYPVKRVRFIVTNKMPTLQKHNAISLGFVVFLRRSRFHPADADNRWIVETLIHEMVHIRQQQRTLIVPWFIAYFLCWIATGFSYGKNPFETNAVGKAKELVAKYYSTKS